LSLSVHAPLERSLLLLTAIYDLGVFPVRVQQPIPIRFIVKSDAVLERFRLLWAERREHAPSHRPLEEHHSNTTNSMRSSAFNFFSFFEYLSSAAIPIQVFGALIPSLHALKEVIDDTSTLGKLVKQLRSCLGWKRHLVIFSPLAPRRVLVEKHLQ